MTTQPIIESGMVFGPYPNGQCFHIEKSNIYDSIKNYVQIAEFLLLRVEETSSPVILVVEAKSSTPRPETQPNFDNFISEVREKMVNSFSLCWASCLNRHQNADRELPETFKSLDLSQTEVRFILVIKGHQESWLLPIHEALSKTLRSTVKTWSFSPTAVAVLNEELAKRYGLIF